ncbi:MAG: winged helix-turn-helix domain-containing protein [Candidatus Ancillula trichonymphae]|nr:winged helix-turn-helix domain-containing protein [Candidatus Ancillula trichonymphae]
MQYSQGVAVRILAMLDESENDFFANRSRGLNVWDFKHLDDLSASDVKFFDCVLIDAQNAGLLEVLSFNGSGDVRASLRRKPMLFYAQTAQIGSTDMRNCSFDDFIVEDASTAELIYRLEAILDKRKKYNAAPQEAKSDGTSAADPKEQAKSGCLLSDVVLREPHENAGKVVVDGLKFSASGFGIEVDGVSVNLTYKELELFSLFVNNPDFVFNRSQILTILWGHNDGTSRLVDVHIRRIRSKIGINHTRHLSTVHGHGYSWQKLVR